MEFAIPLMAVFNIHVIDIYSPHTDISPVGGHLACGLLIYFFLILKHEREQSGRLCRWPQC